MYLPLVGVAQSGHAGLEISKFVHRLERIERKFAKRDLEPVIGKMTEIYRLFSRMVLICFDHRLFDQCYRYAHF